MDVEPNSGVGLFVNLAIQVNYELKNSTLLPMNYAGIPLFTLDRTLNWPEESVIIIYNLNLYL